MNNPEKSLFQLVLIVPAFEIREVFIFLIFLFKYLRLSLELFSVIETEFLSVIEIEITRFALFLTNRTQLLTVFQIKQLAVNEI